MIKPLIFNYKEKELDVKIDLGRVESIIEEARSFVRFERDNFYKEVNRVLKEDETRSDIVSTFNRLKDTLNEDGTVGDLESFREGVSQIIDAIDYLSDLFSKHGLYLTAAKLGEIKLKLPTPYELSIPKDGREVALCLASRRMEVGRDYFILGANIYKRKYFEKAKDYFKGALLGFKKYEEDELAGQMHLVLAIIYDLLEDRHKSSGHFKGAISEYSKLRFDLLNETEKKRMLRRAALIEIATVLMDIFCGKEERKLGQRRRLELALGNFRKVEPDHFASFVHFLALIEARNGYASIRKGLSSEEK